MRKYFLLLLAIFLVIPSGFSQVRFMNLTNQKEEKPPFHGERRKINDLEHTKLVVRLNLREHTMDGEAYIRLHPHFYPTDSLTLDAKFMRIYDVQVNGKKVDYRYDKKQLHIRLPKTFTKDESYRVYVKYLAQPDSVIADKGSAIRDNRGLYFINTRGETKDYPPQVWTQGEPESNSVWFPTIDSPNQKSTEEITIKDIPKGWVSLSNGLKIETKENPDGSHTDTWVLDKPHAPYLFFMAVAPFVKVHDSLGNMDVDYFVEPKYKDVAKMIFGKTPEMIRYFEKITGVKYPWPKFDQIVTRKFVSGAMENTTCVNHSDMAYQDKAELIDRNRWEDVIAHELFHHWFGDLVTAESWSQISMNESFADYSESLWAEHAEGMDKADAIRWSKRMMYFISPQASKKHLVRYRYRKPDDVFDVVSYQKGGLILHMLRHKLGDKAFFAGLHKYLTGNRFGTGEAAKLRLAMEEVSGEDLTEFFRQWFYGAGHPVLDISYKYDDAKGQGQVTILQKTKKIWHFPLNIDVYENGKYHRFPVRVTDSVQTFDFSYTKHPDLVNVGADHVLLAKITDHRSDETYYFQYFHGKNYGDRRMGLDKASEHKQDKQAFAVIRAALDDPFYGFRIKAIQALDVNSPFFTKKIERKLYDLAKYDRKTLVEAAAIRKLGETKRKKYVSLFKKMLKSPSAAVKRAAFEALSKAAPEKLNKIIAGFSDDDMKVLGFAVAKYYIENKVDAKRTFVVHQLFKEPFRLFSPKGQKLLQRLAEWVCKLDDKEANKAYADEVYRLGEKFSQYGFKRLAVFMLSGAIKYQKEGPDNKEIIDYYQSKIDALKK